MDDRSIRAKERSDKLMNLKIKNITCSIKKVPLKRPFITALHKVTEIEGLKIVVELSDGQTGLEQLLLMRKLPVTHYKAR